MDEAMRRYRETRGSGLMSTKDAIDTVHSALLISAYGKTRAEDVRLGKTIEERATRGERVDVPVDVMLASRARYKLTRIPIRPLISASALRSHVANAAVASAYGLLKRAKNTDPAATWVIVAWRVTEVVMTSKVAEIGTEADLAKLAGQLSSYSSIPSDVAGAVKSDPTLAAMATFGDLKKANPAQATLVDRDTDEPAICIEIACIDVSGNAEPDLFMEPDRTGQKVPKRQVRKWYSDARDVIAHFQKVDRVAEPVLTEGQAARAARLLKLFEKEPEVMRQRAVEAAMGQPFAQVAKDIEHYFGDVKPLTKAQLTQARGLALEGISREKIAEILVVPTGAIPTDLVPAAE